MDGTIIISYFGGSNNIFANCMVQYDFRIINGYDSNTGLFSIGPHKVVGSVKLWKFVSLFLYTVFRQFFPLSQNPIIKSVIDILNFIASSDGTVSERSGSAG